MPKLREPPQRAPTPEPIAAPPDEPVEIELTEELPDSTEVDLASGASTPVAAGPPAPAIEHTPPAGDDNALQNALDAQKRAEALQQQAQRDRDAAIRNAQQREQELARERGDHEQARLDSAENGVAAAQSEIERSRAAYQAARAAGDIQSELEANDRWIAARQSLAEWERVKATIEVQREVPRRTDAPPQRQPAPTGLEEKLAAMGIPDVAKQYLRNHPEHVNDPRKIGAAHNYLVEVENVEAFSPAYFDALDARLGYKTQEPAPLAPPAPAPPAQQQRSMPVSAPVSRQAPSVSTGRANPGKITLTPEQRHIARNSFTDPNMTNEQKELLYARNLAKLNAQKANGSYRDERHQQ